MVQGYMNSPKANHMEQQKAGTKVEYHFGAFSKPLPMNKLLKIFVGICGLSQLSYSLIITIFSLDLVLSPHSSGIKPSSITSPGRIPKLPRGQ